MRVSFVVKYSWDIKALDGEFVSLVARNRYGILGPWAGVCTLVQGLWL